MQYNETPFSPKDKNVQMRLDGLLCGVDLQMRLMETIKNQLESYVSTEKAQMESSGLQQADALCTCAEKSAYGSESYMADYVLDDCGKITDVRYDWVKGV